MQKCLVIIGMHRSGTSLLTGMLAELDVYLGKDLLAANDFNQKGYFENSEIVAFNDSIFYDYNSDWNDPFFNVNNIKKDDFNHYIKQAVSIIKNNFGTSSLFAIKDPRISLLLPLWLKVFERCKVNVYFIHVYRDPLQVAKSLEFRDGFTLEKGLILWVHYLLNIEKYTKNQEKLSISYNDMIDNSFMSLENLLIRTKISSENIKKATQFIEKKLNHHDFTFSQNKKEIAPFLKKAINVILENLVSDNCEKFNILRESFYKNKESIYKYDALSSRQHIKLLRKRFSDDLINEKNNSKSHIEYRDNLISELKRRVVKEKENSEKQIQYRDELVSQLELGLKNEKNNASKQIKYRDNLITTLKLNLENEKKNANKQIKYRDQLIDQVKINLSDEKENSKNQVRYRDERISELELNLSNEKKNAEKQIKYRDSKINELELNLLAEKENSEKQIKYRDELLREAIFNLENEKINAEKQIKYRDELILEVQDKLKIADDNLKFREILISVLENKIVQ